MQADSLIFSIILSHRLNLKAVIFLKTNLSCEAGAGGGKPGLRHGCFCRHPPAGGGQIAALQPWQPASGPPINAGGRILEGTTMQHRPGPSGRWVKDDRGPSNKSTGFDWPGQNPPGKSINNAGEVTLSRFLKETDARIEHKVVCLDV